MPSDSDHTEARSDWFRSSPRPEEIRKTRPAVIVSNDTTNALINRVQVVPISSQVGGLYPAEAIVTLNGARRKVMADQIITVSSDFSGGSARSAARTRRLLPALSA